MIKEETCRQVIEFNQSRNWENYHTPENLAKSISIEAAELLELYQWQSEELDHRTKEKIANELADIAIYMIDFCEVESIDIDRAIKKKLQKNALKYPI